MAGKVSRRRALDALGLDARRVAALLRLCEPQRHGGAVLAVRASRFLAELLAVAEAPVKPAAARRPPRRPTRHSKPAPAAGGARPFDDSLPDWMA